MLDGAGLGEASSAEFAGKKLSEVLQDVERRYICEMLNAHGGNKAEAARASGLEYQTFLRKLKKLDLRVTYHAG